MRRGMAAWCFAVLLASSAAPARADSVTYITGGNYTIGATGDSYWFYVPGDPNPPVLVMGSVASVPGISAMTCLICDPGTSYAIGRHTAGNGFLGEADLGTGTFATGGVTTNFRYAGWFTFLADPIILPPSATGQIAFAVPFRVRVSLDGIDLDHPGGGIFTRWLGMGTAHVSFTSTSDGRWRNDSGQLLRFQFSSDPVPEPATMFLLGTGLAGLAARRARLSR